MGLRQACFITKGQCTPTIVQKLEGSKECKDIHARHDAIEMLKLIKNINCKFEDQKIGTFKNILASLRGMVNGLKKPEQSLMEHQDRFINQVSLFEQFGNIAGTEAIANTNPKIKELWNQCFAKTNENKRNVSVEEIAKLGEEARNKFLAHLFIRKLDGACD